MATILSAILVPEVRSGQTTVNRSEVILHFIRRIRLKIAKKCGLYLDIFCCVSLSDSKCMSDAITSTKLEQTGEIFWDSREAV